LVAHSSTPEDRVAPLSLNKADRRWPPRLSGGTSEKQSIFPFLDKPTCHHIVLILHGL